MQQGYCCKQLGCMISVAMMGWGGTCKNPYLINEDAKSSYVTLGGVEFQGAVNVTQKCILVPKSGKDPFKPGSYLFLAKPAAFPFNFRC